MSPQVRVSAAFSVLMMAAYVLFGADAAVTSLDSDSVASPFSVSAPALLSTSRLLPSAR